MTVFIILMLCALLILMAQLLSQGTGAKPNGTILLGVTLPSYELGNSQVLKIVRDYRKANLLTGGGFFVLLFPGLLVYQYGTVLLLYLLVWCILLLYTGNTLQKIYFHKLYSLKREKGWYAGERHVISIDTEASRRKRRMPVSRLWFIPAFMIALTPAAVSFPGMEERSFAWIMAACSLLYIVISLLAHLQIAKERTVSYSEDTEINLALNRSYKYQWSKCWVAEAYMGSVFNILLYFLLRGNTFPVSVTALLIFTSILPAFVPVLYAYHKVGEERRGLLSFISAQVYSDEDHYWEKGSYYNPNDKRVWVEKRFGYGTTINMASTFGKLINWVYAAVIIGVIAIVFFLMPLDFGSIDFQIKSNTVYIDAPLYEDHFSLEDIKEVKLIEELPIEGKRNGGDSYFFYVGGFKVRGYGMCRVYVYRNHPPYIAAVLSDRVVIFNGKTPEDTKNCYLQLTK